MTAGSDASGNSQNGAWAAMPAKTIPGTLAFPDWCVEAFAGKRRMLEIGCGPHGGLAPLAAQIEAEFSGTDINPQAVAGSCAAWPRFRFFTHDAVQPFPLDAGCFDLIAMKAFMTCLPARAEHLAVLANARKVATDGCLLAVMDFLQNWDVPLYKTRYEEGIAHGLERGTFAAPANAFTAGYNAHHFERVELKELLRETGWNLKRIEAVPVVTRSGNRVSGFALLAGC
jgi:hypothetical protein